MERQHSNLIVRMLGFTAWPLISLVTPLLITPVIARLAGNGWSSVVTAMSIGTFGSTVIIWGWNYIGPARVASAEDGLRSVQYELSLWTRLFLVLGTVPIAGILSYLISVPSLRIDSVLMAVSFSLGGLSPQWYCIGIGRASLLGLFDTLPRAVSTVVALPFVLSIRQIWPYPCLLIVSTFVSLVLFQFRIFGHHKIRCPSVKNLLSEISGMAAAAGVNLIGNAYSYAPVPIATAFLLPADSSSFASADQLYRYALFSIVALGNALQGWVLEIEGRDGRRRQQAAVLLHVLLGLSGGLVLGLLGLRISTILFGASVAAGQVTSALYGITFLAISTSTPFLRNILIPQGRATTVLAVTILSAIVGLFLMFIGAMRGSSSGIAAGLTASEVILTCVVTVVGVKMMLHHS